jgi:hypothetical protein
VLFDLFVVPAGDSIGPMPVMKYPYWEQYKDKVQARNPDMGLYFQLGVALIRTVEDSDSVEFADMICMRHVSRNAMNWDYDMEDEMAESNVFSAAVKSIFIQMVLQRLFM